RCPGLRPATWGPRYRGASPVPLPSATAESPPATRPMLGGRVPRTASKSRFSSRETRLLTLDERDSVPVGHPASSRVQAPDHGWHGAPVELPRPPAPLRSPGIGLFRQYGAVLFPSRQGKAAPALQTPRHAFLASFAVWPGRGFRAPPRSVP